MLFAIVKICVSLLTPTVLYTLGSQIYLVRTARLDRLLRANCALLLTSSILTAFFLGIWFLARTNATLRPPSSGKRLAFGLSLVSTILWIAAAGSGVRIARTQPGCLTASVLAGVGPEAWRFGTACRLQRAGVAFSLLGFFCSVVILVTMVEISDRPFGGVGTDERVTAVAEKFREALKDLREENESGSEERDEAV